ncbi:MAG: ECF transporter S component [Erysipelotrichaceae bacterium]
MNPNRKRIVEITTLGLFIAIIFVMTFVPNIGYIQVNILTITTIHIPVIIGSVFLGPLGGLVLGLTWGVTSWLKVLTSVVSPLEKALFLNPLISIVPRVLVGLAVSYAYLALKKFIKKEPVRDIVVAVIGPAANTILVLGAITLFAGGTAFPQNETLTRIIATLISTNGIVEIVASVLLVPIILRRLRKIRNV